MYVGIIMKAHTSVVVVYGFQNRANKKTDFLSKLVFNELYALGIAGRIIQCRFERSNGISIIKISIYLTLVHFKL